MSQPDLLATIGNIENRLSDRNGSYKTFLKHLVAKLIIIREVIKRIKQRIVQCQRELEEARQRQDRDRVPGIGGPDVPPFEPRIGQPDQSGELKALLKENASLRQENANLNAMVLEANNRLGKLVTDLNKYMEDADTVTAQIQELLGIKGEKRIMSEEDINNIYEKFLLENPGMDDIQLEPYYEENIGMGPNGAPINNQSNEKKPQPKYPKPLAHKVKKLGDNKYEITLLNGFTQGNDFFQITDGQHGQINPNNEKNYIVNGVTYKYLIKNDKNKKWEFTNRDPLKGGNSTRKKHRKPKSNRKTKRRHH